MNDTCTVCKSDDMFDDNHCWEHAEYTEHKTDGKECKLCGSYFKEQYGAFKRHQRSCKG